MTKDEVINRICKGSVCNLCKNDELSGDIEPCSSCYKWSNFELVEVEE